MVDYNNEELRTWVVITENPVVQADSMNSAEVKVDHMYRGSKKLVRVCEVKLLTESPPKVPGATLDEALEAISEALQIMTLSSEEELMDAITDLANGHYKAAQDLAEEIVREERGE